MFPPHTGTLRLPLHYIPKFLFFNLIFRLPDEFGQPFLCSLDCPHPPNFILWVMLNSLYNKNDGKDGPMGEGRNG
jgi:hypothetical protein